jgi:hypothetical protein
MVTGRLSRRILRTNWSDKFSDGRTRQYTMLPGLDIACFALSGLLAIREDGLAFRLHLFHLVKRPEVVSKKWVLHGIRVELIGLL